MRRRAAGAAGGEHDGLGADRLQAAVQEIPGDHALAAVVVDDELPGEELLIDLEVALHDLLVEDVDEHVAGDVRRIGGPRRPRGAEGPLRDAPVVGAREDRAPVLELVDVAGRLVAEDLDRVLVAQVVGALDGVVGVLLGTVLGRVPERRVDPALGRAGVAADRMDLREKRDVRAEIVSLDRGAHAGAPGADDEHVVRCFHYCWTLPNGERCVPCDSRVDQMHLDRERKERGRKLVPPPSIGLSCVSAAHFPIGGTSTGGGDLSAVCAGGATHGG